MAEIDENTNMFVRCKGKWYFRATGFIPNIAFLIGAIGSGRFDNLDGRYVLLDDAITYFEGDPEGVQILAELRRIKAKFDAGDVNLFDDQNRPVDINGSLLAPPNDPQITS